MRRDIRLRVVLMRYDPANHRRYEKIRGASHGVTVLTTRAQVRLWRRVCEAVRQFQEETNGR